MFTLIQHQSQLEQLLLLMQSEDAYFLDTEFVRQQHRYPVLGILQLNICQQNFIIDPKKLDLSAFWQLIFSSRLKVFHSFGEDISIMYHYSNLTPLSHIFDTQLGLAFLNYGMTLGYQTALKELLDITIFKYETRSNWLNRPLSTEQLEYAANDVHYLPQLHQLIKDELIEKGLYQAVLEDCYHQGLIVRQLDDNDPATIYKNLAKHSHTRRQLAQYQQITEWREHYSRQYNVTPSCIIKDSEIAQLISTQPKNEYEISKLLKSSHKSRYIPRLLKLLHRLPSATSWPERLPAPYISQNPDLNQHIQDLINDTAQRLDLPKECVIKKKWIGDILNLMGEMTRQRGDERQLPHFLLGWRYDIITQPLIKLLYDDWKHQ